MTWGYEDVRRLLAGMEREWDVYGMHGEGGNGNGRQSLTIKFKRKVREERDIG